jgi:hypothetical protein
LIGAGSQGNLCADAGHHRPVTELATENNMSENNHEQRILELEKTIAVLNKNFYTNTCLLIDVCRELSTTKNHQHQLGENIYHYLENVVDWAEFADPEKRKMLKVALLRTVQIREQTAAELADFESKINKIQPPPLDEAGPGTVS